MASALVSGCGGISTDQTPPSNLTKTNSGPDLPPKVRITFPRDGSSVFGMLQAVADARDDRPGLSVEFFLNGESLGVASARPYQLSWSAPSVPGPFKLKAVATDSGGHTESHEVTLVKPDQYPTIAFDTPQDGATVRGQVPLFAMTDDDVGIRFVEYSIDGVIMDSVTPGHSVIWDTTTVENNRNYLVQAVAQDSRGHRTAVQSRVHVLDAPPEVSFLSPSGVTVVGGTVRFKAAATDDDGIISVTYFVDGVPIGAISAAPYLLDWSSKGIPDGTEVTVTAQALDTRGQTSEAELKLTIQNRAVPRPED